jgi:hypothetical protein
VAHSFTAKTVHYRASPDMTSGEFHSIEINSITINRKERQRQQLKEAQLEDLAGSIEDLGLIHPIVVTRELEQIPVDFTHSLHA